MKSLWIDKSSEAYADNIQKSYYENDFIPAEKKKYLSNLKKSCGPYLSVDSNQEHSQYLLDAASQIATLGLGFNPIAYFGAAHHVENWTNLCHSKFANTLKVNFKKFFRRVLNQQYQLHFCHSGAEANEIALGYAYQSRQHPMAKKVLVFEGSFHGRMQISLSSTWNPTKRKQFEWEDTKQTFVPYPEIDSDQFTVEIPKGWRELWEDVARKNFSVPTELAQETQLKQEIDILLQVREKLLSRQIYAILIEPMQCEGGDRYSTNRFHTALNLMAQALHIPLIYDEVQTGFHLGRHFFWHQTFDLKDSQGQRVFPAYITMAKKAQVGLCLSRFPQKKFQLNDEYHLLSLHRGYLQALELEQSHDKILNLEKNIQNRLLLLCQSYQQLKRPRVCGLCFAFELEDNETVQNFVSKRFEVGMLFYPAGEKTLRFRVNLGFKESDLDYLFQGLEKLCQNVFNQSPIIQETTFKLNHHVEHLYNWHTRLLTSKWESARNFSEEFKSLEQFFKKEFNLDLVSINHENFDQFKDKIHSLEEEVYEPSRRTSIELFEKGSQQNECTAFALLDKDKIAALCFASKLSAFPLEKSLRLDEEFDKDGILYVLDTTTAPAYQGQRIGLYLRYTLTLLAQTKGFSSIRGRNRQVLALPMLKINLSQGAIDKFYIKENYLDLEKYRDVIYYSQPLSFKRNSLKLTHALTSPLHRDDIDSTHIEDKLPAMINKVCLSNFVSQKFLELLKDFSKLLPQDLQHLYTTSGQSECVDKIVKSYWLKFQKPLKFVTFKGHFFGSGSFLSRSLSQEQDFFDVTILEHPDENNHKDVLKKLEKLLTVDQPVLVWLEPLKQLDWKPTSRHFLKQLKSLKKNRHLNIIYNETAASFYRYSNKSFFSFETNEDAPDALMYYAGGQCGLCALNPKTFVSKPLTLISTWDGDEASLDRFVHASKVHKANKDQFEQVLAQFESKLKSFFELYDIDSFHIHRGYGQFTGRINKRHQDYFLKSNHNTYLFQPHVRDMERYIKEVTF